MINKRKFEIRNNKKVLHKVGKQWLTISTLMLALIGGSALVGKTTHADVINNNGADNNNNPQSAAHPITSNHPSNVQVKTASNSASSISALAHRVHGSLVNHAAQNALQSKQNSFQDKAPHVISANTVKHVTAPSNSPVKANNRSNLNASNLPHTKGIIPSDNKKNNTRRPMMLFGAQPSFKGLGASASEQNLGTVNLTYNGASVKPMNVSEWLKDTLHKPSFTFSINNNTYFVPGPSDSSDNYFSDSPSDSTLEGINSNIENNLKINKNNITYTVKLNKLNKINVELGHMVNNKYEQIKPKHIKHVDDKVLHITSNNDISDEGIIGTTHDIDNTSFTLPLVAGQFIPKRYSYNIKHEKYEGKKAPNQLKNYYVLNQHSLAQTPNSNYGNVKLSDSDGKIQDGTFYYANVPYTIKVVLKPRPVKLASDYINYTYNGNVIIPLYNKKGDTTKIDPNVGTVMSKWVSSNENIPNGYTISAADKNNFKNIFSQRMNNQIKFGSAQYNIPLEPITQPAKKTNTIEYTYNGQVINTPYHSDGPANSDDYGFGNFVTGWPTAFDSSDEASDVSELHDYAGLPKGYTLSLSDMSKYYNKLNALANQSPAYGSVHLTIPVEPAQQPQQNLGTIKAEFVDANGNVLKPNVNGLSKSDKYLHINGNIVSDIGGLNFTLDPANMAFDFDTVMTPFMPKGYTNAGQIHEKGLKGQYDLLSHIVGATLTKSNAGSDQADRIYTLKNGQQLYFRNDGSNDFALDYMPTSTTPTIKIGVVPAGTVTVNKYDTDNHNKLMSTSTFIGAQGSDTNLNTTAPKGYTWAKSSGDDPLHFNAKPQTLNVYYKKIRTNDAINYMNKDIHDSTAQVINDVPYRGIKGASDTDMNDFVAKLEQDIDNTKPNQVPDVSNLPGIPKGYTIAPSDINTNIGDELNSFTGENSDSTSGITYGNNTLKLHLVPDVSVDFVTNKHHKLLNHILVAKPLYENNIYNYHYIPDQYKVAKVDYNNNTDVMNLIVAKPIKQSTITIHYIADEGKGKANPVISTKAVTGNVNDPFDATDYLSQIPSGYEYKRVSSVDRFTKRNQNAYVYLTPVNPPKLTISTITVNYKDGSQTVASRNISRPVSTEFTVNDCLDNLPSGYQYKGYRSNNIDHFDYDNHSVTVFVTKVPNRTPAKSTITVNYVDNDKTVASSKTTADVSTDYDVGQHLNIPDGYVYKGMEGSTDDYHYNDQTVTVLVAKEPKANVAKSTITINYIDGSKVVARSKDTQPVSTDYDVYDHLSVPSGYIYKGIQNSNVNDFHYNDQVINVLVAKEPQRKVAKSTITVNYVNADTPNHQLIKKAGSDTENITTPFSIGSYLKNIPNGYEYVGINNNIDSFDYDNHTVDILLHKVINSTITVDYIDTENNHVIKSTKSTEPEGTKFNSNDYESEAPNGYKSVSIKNTTNSFAKNNQTVDIYVALKAHKVPVTPTKPSNSAKPSESASAKPNSASAPASSSAQPAPSSANKPMNSKSNSSQPSAHASASSANHASVPSSTASHSASASSASLEPTYKPSASHSTSHKSAQSIANHNASKSNNIIKPSSLAKGNSINTANHSVSIAHNYNVRVNRNTQSKLPQTNESSADSFMIASILLGIISAMLLSYSYDSRRKHI